MALQADALQSRNVTLVFHFCSAFINKENQASIFFTAEKVKSVRDMARARGEYYILKEQRVQGEGKLPFFRRALLNYQLGWGAAIILKRSAEVQNRDFVTSEGFGTFAEAPRNVLQSLDYPDSLLESFFEDFLLFMLLIFEVK